MPTDEQLPTGVGAPGARAPGPDARHGRNALLFALGGAVVLASLGIGAVLHKLTGARLDAEDHRYLHQRQRPVKRPVERNGEGGWLRTPVPDE